MPHLLLCPGTNVFSDFPVPGTAAVRVGTEPGVAEAEVLLLVLRGF